MMMMQTRLLKNGAVIAMMMMMVCTGLFGCTSRSASDEPMVFPSAGPLAVDVASFNGDVNIHVDPRLDEVSVSVVREADYGYRRSSEAKAALEAVQYSAVIEPGDLGPVLRVRTWSDAPEAYYQRAHVTINLPAAENIFVRTTRGRVYAVDIRGDVDIETTGGDVRVMTNHPMTQAVTIVNNEGDIDYRVRAESTGAIRAETVDGKVRQRATYGRFLITENSLRRMVATLNGGTNPIELRTVEGDIRIAIIPNPTAVGMLIIDP